ncbi:hypothetical protein [Natronogracilivirga saccharolytica]|uniref:Uncharacterized protein n=1 Tax=Natronogracilivirga saccharolytica TaxID=2812953 RepID=A0A8J7RS55_9BACT|nr:hypothetical protein [Natronogracilivirga saccharolytica]MBP3191952.1 hypothetical protein [Natronogracilivirga saccharolytica]
MTSISRIAELAKIPEIHRKKRESQLLKKKRQKEDEERPPFPLKGKPCFRKPRTGISRPPVEKKQPRPPSSEDGVGDQLDLKV